MSALKSQAFYGAEFVRTEVLDGLASGQRAGALMRLWMGGRSGEARFDVIAAEYGLDPGLVRLVAGLGGDPLDTDVQRFVTEVVKALPLGGKIDDVASDWLLWTWDHGLVSLADRLAGTAVEAPARAVLELLRANRETPVEQTRFRQARNAVRKAAEQAPACVEFAEVVQAMAWDCKRMPGVIGDVVLAWSSAIRQDSLQASGWTKDMEQSLDAVRTRIFDETVAEVRAAGLTDQEEMVKRVREGEDQRWQESGQTALRDQRQACAAQASLRVAEWTEQARAGLFACLRQAGEASTATVTA